MLIKILTIIKIVLRVVHPIKTLLLHVMVTATQFQTVMTFASNGMFISLEYTLGIVQTIQTQTTLSVEMPAETTSV